MRLLLAKMVGGLFCLSSAWAGVVEDWNAAFIQAVRKETPPPCLVSRNLPILHVAIYRAVKDVAHRGMDEETQERAALLAGEQVFSQFFPSQGRLADEVKARHPNGDVLPAVKEAVHEAVVRTLSERENDGSSTTVHYVPSEKPGQWRRTPPNFRPPEFPHWGGVKPFVVEDVRRFRAPPPPAMDTDAYAKEVNTVRDFGGKISASRTEEQSLIARFWADFSYTTSPAGHWNDIARQLSLRKKSPVAEVARLFAVLDTALADACIAIWDTKYHYNLWRPVTAIQRADEDGNEATLKDEKWMSMLPCPPHPEYVSGHSGISGAAAAILEHFFGVDAVEFEADSDDVKDVRRKFTSFRACAEEIAMSRVYGGIHYPMAGKNGLQMGQKVAAEVLEKFSY